MLFVIAAVASEPFRVFMMENYWLLVVCCLLSFAIWIVLVCFRKHAREVPKNYILLVIFTLCESYMIAYPCAFVEPLLVLITVIATFVYVGILTAYAAYTTRDLTKHGGAILYAFIALIILIIIGVFFPSELLNFIICLAIFAFFSFLLCY